MAVVLKRCARMFGCICANAFWHEGHANPSFNIKGRISIATLINIDLSSGAYAITFRTADYDYLYTGFINDE